MVLLFGLKFCVFQSTRPVRGGTSQLYIQCNRQNISIHPPRAGRDSGYNEFQLIKQNFNPPAPCGAGQVLTLLVRVIINFNPPAPCGAGRITTPITKIASNFNPPAPCGAGPRAFRPPLWGCHISIHPPRAGRDVSIFYCVTYSCISIHPPRAGRDDGCGHRPPSKRISIHPPRAGRDHWSRIRLRAERISIHPPRAGRDVNLFYYAKEFNNFNPPAPCGAGPV